MKGFKSTGRGPKSGHSFSSKAGYTGSTGRTRQVSGYTQSVPKAKPKFATGGMVVERGTDGGSALTRRAQPITDFDRQAGGKTPLRPGFSRGGLGARARDVAGQAMAARGNPSATPVVSAGTMSRPGGLAALTSRAAPARVAAVPAQGRGGPGYGGFNRSPFIKG